MSKVGIILILLITCSMFFSCERNNEEKIYVICSVSRFGNYVENSDTFLLIKENVDKGVLFKYQSIDSTKEELYYFDTVSEESYVTVKHDTFIMKRNLTEGVAVIEPTLHYWIESINKDVSYNLFVNWNFGIIKLQAESNIYVYNYLDSEKKARVDSILAIIEEVNVEMPVPPPARMTD